MPWVEIRFQTRKENAESLSELLTQVGAVAVTLEDAADQPLYEPPPGATPLWAKTVVTGLFEAETVIEDVILELHAASGPVPLPDFGISQIGDRDWQRECLDRFQPCHYGGRLWVCPSWHQPPDPTAINLLLDPGLAFGTGMHATTALCLEWLANADVSGKTVVDFGCGSGILGIAAARLGASHVWCLDNDPQAITASADNALKNGLTEKISVRLAEGEMLVQTDVLLANILADPLISLASSFAKAVREGGTVILSGILSEQAASVVAAYQPWFSMAEPTVRDSWICLDGTRKYVIV